MIKVKDMMRRLKEYLDEGNVPGLCGFVVHGSYGRMDPHEDSDLDITIISRNDNVSLSYIESDLRNKLGIKVMVYPQKGIRMGHLREDCKRIFKPLYDDPTIQLRAYPLDRFHPGKIQLVTTDREIETQILNEIYQVRYPSDSPKFKRYIKRLGSRLWDLLKRWGTLSSFYEK